MECPYRQNVTADKYKFHRNSPDLGLGWFLNMGAMPLLEDIYSGPGYIVNYLNMYFTMYPDFKDMILKITNRTPKEEKIRKAFLFMLYQPANYIYIKGMIFEKLLTNLQGEHSAFDKNTPILVKARKELSNTFIKYVKKRYVCAIIRRLKNLVVSKLLVSLNQAG